MDRRLRTRDATVTRAPRAAIRCGAISLCGASKPPLPASATIGFLMRRSNKTVFSHHRLAAAATRQRFFRSTPARTGHGWPETSLRTALRAAPRTQSRRPSRSVPAPLRRANGMSRSPARADQPWCSNAGKGEPEFALRYSGLDHPGGALLAAAVQEADRRLPPQRWRSGIGLPQVWLFPRPLFR